MNVIAQRIRARKDDIMKGKNVIVAGAGKSGVASVGLLIRNGANVTLFDGNKNQSRRTLKEFFSE